MNSSFSIRLMPQPSCAQVCSALLLTVRLRKRLAPCQVFASTLPIASNRQHVGSLNVEWLPQTQSALRRNRLSSSEFCRWRALLERAQGVAQTLARTKEAHSCNCPSPHRLPPLPALRRSAGAARLAGRCVMRRRIVLVSREPAQGALQRSTICDEPGPLFASRHHTIHVPNKSAPAIPSLRVRSTLQRYTGWSTHPAPRSTSLHHTTCEEEPWALNPRQRRTVAALCSR